MRIYQNCLEMYSETERELFEMGVRYQSHSVQDQVVEDDKGYETHELMMYGYQLSSFHDMEQMVENAGISLDWCEAELEERLGTDRNLPFINPGQAYKLRNALWDSFLHDGKFAYTYAERWQEQIYYVIDQLVLRPNTRQAIMTMYDRHQDMMNWGGQSRVPCSVSYQFALREGRLHLMYHQRSCDFKKFFPADVYFTVGLLKHVAAMIGAKEGIFTHVIGSLHVFAKDMPEGVF